MSVSHAVSAEVTTIALLQRRQGMSDELFTAYWRDVHGMLATRIPGFLSYVQNHTERYGSAPDAAPGADGEAPIVLDGFAEVSYRNEADRQGLVTGDVTPLILRDESRVFSRTLLYNLEPGGTRTLVGDIAAVAQSPAASFVLILQSFADSSAAEIAAAVERELVSPLRASEGLLVLRLHLLTSGDPTRWSTVSGVDNRQRGAVNSVALQVSWDSLASADKAIAALRAKPDTVLRYLQCYRVKARYEMVIGGRPTHLGLRGFDVLRTIEAAGADNQKDETVLRCLYGAAALGLPR
ncbi:MAG: hypothetical protein JWQ90_4105 [Hydrocarboniphaga sp.]|uniref:EthD domain-containing protein n=1 Tax=Hydrocarboniphaga sp. TaxID=2033016 RepID=UPI002604AAED|nr:EthD domain-containing protein [Hydrocarboniphaga sp.]MDB5971655.1 hypothetical protein [Hydrocarboniphaga sp.]